MRALAVLVLLLAAGCLGPKLPATPSTDCAASSWMDAIASPPKTAASEVSLAVDPTDPLHVVAAANSGGGFGVYQTHDGGVSWTGQVLKSTDLLGPEGNALIGLSDPSVVFSSDGTAHIAGLAYIPLSSVFVASQAKGASTWTGKLAWLSEPVATSNDKEWLGIDPVSGTMVLAWQREPLLDQLRAADTTTGKTDVDLGLIVASRSTDGGATWSTPATISSSLHNNGTQVQFLHGVAHVTWIDYEKPALVEATSSDLGQTWTAPRTLARISIGHAFQGYTRMHTLPGMAAGNGTLAIAWHDSRDDGGDIYVLRGDGTTWGQPERVPDDPLVSGRIQLYPWPAYDGSGRLHVTYASGDRAGFTYRHIEREPDGTWSRPTDVSRPFRVFGNATAGPADLGDYTGLAYGGQRLYAAWSQPEASLRDASAVHVAALGLVPSTCHP